MMSTSYLSLRSMRNRLFSSLLTIFSIALSVCLLISIERIRLGVKQHFERTLSGMDLVVGPRGGSLQVLLYSVFHVGSPNNNISWHSYEDLRAHPEVSWTIPISMGDSHRGFPVIGTDENYFGHYQIAGLPLSFSEGRAFDGKASEAVIGSAIAKKLKYKVGDPIILSHGMGETSFHQHDDHPITIVGILNESGSPADQSVHVSLRSLEAMHHDHDEEADHEHAHDHEHEHGDERAPISAFLVGLKAKQGVLSFQRMVNDYEEEPLMAIVPGLTFMELWSLMSTADTALFLVSILVIFAGVLGMLSAMLSALENRRREIAILRALGARPRTIFSLFLSEAVILGLLGFAVGLVLASGLIYGLQPFLVRHYGFHMPILKASVFECALFLAVLALASLAGLIPAWKAYRQALTDGLTIRF